LRHDGILHENIKGIVKGKTTKKVNSNAI